MLFRLHLLKSTKDTESLPLLDFPYNKPDPEFNPPFKLPNKSLLETLSLTEGESRRPRQSTEGTVCYRFRPP